LAQAARLYTIGLFPLAPFSNCRGKEAGLIDELHIAIVPVLLGSGEHLLTGIDTLALGYACSEHDTTSGVMHAVLTKRR